MSDQTPPPDDSGAFDPSTPPPPAPPGDAAPPPPPPADVPPPVPAASGSSVDVGAAFSWAMAKFQAHWQVLVGLALVVFAINLVGRIITNVLLNNAANNCTPNAVVVGQDNIVISGNCSTGFFATLGITALVGVIFGVLAFLAQVGIYRAALKTTLGETPAFENLTSGENLGAYIVTVIVFGILFWLGFFLCLFIGGLVIAFLLLFAPVFSLDKGLGVGDAFRSSYKVVTSNFVPVLLTAIISFVAMALGSLFFGILTLVALPFSALFVAHIYRQLNKEPIAA